MVLTSVGTQQVLCAPLTDSPAPHPDECLEALPRTSLCSPPLHSFLELTLGLRLLTRPSDPSILNSFRSFLFLLHHCALKRVSL